MPRTDPLTVAIRDSRPFTYSEDGVQKGFAVDLWNRIAGPEQIGLDSGIVAYRNLESQEVALKSGEVDVVISPLTITAKRLDSYDFSQQYLASGLTLAVPSSKAINFEEAKNVVVQTLFQKGVWNALVLFLVFNLVVAYLIRLALRAANPDAPPQGRFSAAAGYTLEAIVRTTGLKGVGDGFNSVAGKLLEIFMAIVGTALSATILGILTSAFVGAIGEASSVPRDRLTEMRLAVLKCSTTQDFLKEQYEALREDASLSAEAFAAVEERIAQLACTEAEAAAEQSGPAESYAHAELPGGAVLTSTWEAAVALLAAEKVDGVLGDWVQITYLVRQSEDWRKAIDVQSKIYRNEPYGWAITRATDAQGCPLVSADLKRRIDQQLIKAMRNIAWRDDVAEVLKTDVISPN